MSKNGWHFGSIGGRLSTSKAANDDASTSKQGESEALKRQSASNASAALKSARENARKPSGVGGPSPPGRGLAHHRMSVMVDEMA